MEDEIRAIFTEAQIEIIPWNTPCGRRDSSYPLEHTKFLSEFSGMCCNLTFLSFRRNISELFPDCHFPSPTSCRRKISLLSHVGKIVVVSWEAIQLPCKQFGLSVMKKAICADPGRNP